MKERMVSETWDDEGEIDIEVEVDDDDEDEDEVEVEVDDEETGLWDEAADGDDDDL
jgi:hypothetical protein